MSIHASGPAFATIMADHDRGPEYAFVECIGEGCSARSTIEGSYALTTEELAECFVDQGWSIRPTLCPDCRAALPKEES